jgi:hypothetical protein
LDRKSLHQGNQRALKRRSVVFFYSFFFKEAEVIYRNVGASGVALLTQFPLHQNGNRRGGERNPNNVK